MIRLEGTPLFSKSSASRSELTRIGSTFTTRPFADEDVDVLVEAPASAVASFAAAVDVVTVVASGDAAVEASLTISLEEEESRDALETAALVDDGRLSTRVGGELLESMEGEIMVDDIEDAFEAFAAATAMAFSSGDFWGADSNEVMAVGATESGGGGKFFCSCCFGHCIGGCGCDGDGKCWGRGRC